MRNKCSPLRNFTVTVPNLLGVKENHFLRSIHKDPEGLGRKVGVAGLEEKNIENLRQNSNFIDIAFTDLYTLMLSAEKLFTITNYYQSSVKDEAQGRNNIGKLLYSTA